MRIRDWSSDVCSSDLPVAERPRVDVVTGPNIDGVLAWYLCDVPSRWVASANESPDDPIRVVVVSTTLPRDAAHAPLPAYALSTIGRASCTERVCQYV